jgi:hypothetical protein
VRLKSAVFIGQFGNGISLFLSFLNHGQQQSLHSIVLHQELLVETQLDEQSLDILTVGGTGEGVNSLLKLGRPEG